MGSDTFFQPHKWCNIGLQLHCSTPKCTFLEENLATDTRNLQGTGDRHSDRDTRNSQDYRLLKHWCPLAGKKFSLPAAIHSQLDMHMGERPGKGKHCLLYTVGKRHFQVRQRMSLKDTVLGTYCRSLPRRNAPEDTTDKSAVVPVPRWNNIRPCRASAWLT